MKLGADEIDYRIGGQLLLDRVGIEAADGEIVALIGPNGSGKSTLLRLLYRALRPQSGRAWLGDDDLWAMGRSDVSRIIGAVPQDVAIDFELTVVELVSLGRLPHQRAFAVDSNEDRHRVAAAMERAGIGRLAGRRLDQISGGERQRAAVARALAQEATVLLLDEPTNHLDIGAQHDLMTMIVRLGVTTVVAMHDLNLAATYSDRAVLLVQGRVAMAGPTADVLSSDLVENAYKVGISRVENPDTGRLSLMFHHRDRPGPITPSPPPTPARSASPSGLRSDHRVR